MRLQYHADTPTLSELDAMAPIELRRFIVAHEHDRFATIEAIGGRDYATLVDDLLSDYATVRLHLLDCRAHGLRQRAAMYARLADVIRARIPDDRLHVAAHPLNRRRHPMESMPPGGRARAH